MDVNRQKCPVRKIPNRTRREFDQANYHDPTIISVQIPINLGRGGSQVVSVLAFYSDDLTLNPEDCASEFNKICNVPDITYFPHYVGKNSIMIVLSCFVYILTKNIFIKSIATFHICLTIGPIVQCSSPSTKELHEHDITLAQESQATINGKLVI